MPSSVGYSTGGSLGSGAPGVNSDDEQAVNGFWPHKKCRQAYITYLDSKRLEIEEQHRSRRYRHGVQWTSEQIKTLNERKQPVVTFNKIGRKYDGIVGVVERLRQDPKAFPRTPQHQAGADLATAVLRYLMDRNNWNEIVPQVSEAAALDGLAGIELGLKKAPPTAQTNLPPNLIDQGQPDYDIIFGKVDNDGFFYDPRSFRHDFSDARFLGMGKFVDEEQLLELMPELKDKLSNTGGSGDLDLTSGSDRDHRWFEQEGEFKQIRLVDIWYRVANGWRWCLFTGSQILMQGESPFKDEYGQQFCKYVMFSASVDHDGDRYGFCRNLISPQDEVNQRRSKSLHEGNSRRIIATKAAIADGNVEAVRREAARADGIVLVNTSLQDIQFDDMAKQAAVMGQLEMMRNAAQEIEGFGPTPALVGGNVGEGGLTPGSSGRAIALMQQSGIAELGPYMLNLRGWKIRVYRALFNSAQSYWTNQRWIRVTDSQGEPQFVAINELAIDPQTGMPMIKNQIGELDVDIILDEGPDTVTLMQDTYDAIANTLPAVAKMLSPAQAAAAMDVLIETSPLAADAKKRFRDAGAQEQGPPPEQQAAMAKLQMEQQIGQQKLQLDGAKMQQDAQLKRESAQVDIQMEQAKLALEREKAALQLQLEREKAENQMAIEQYKANNQAQIAAQKAAADTQQKQYEMQFNEPEDEVDMRTLHFRNGLVLDRDKERRAAEAGRASKTDEALSRLIETIAQSHQGLLSAVGKPRRAVIQRDPKTNRVIGAMSVME